MHTRFNWIINSIFVKQINADTMRSKWFSATATDPLLRARFFMFAACAHFIHIYFVIIICPFPSAIFAVVVFWSSPWNDFPASFDTICCCLFFILSFVIILLALLLLSALLSQIHPTWVHFGVNPRHILSGDIHSYYWACNCVLFMAIAKTISHLAVLRRYWCCSFSLTKFHVKRKSYLFSQNISTN